MGIPNLYQPAFSNNTFYNRQPEVPTQTTSSWSHNVFNGPPTNPSTSLALRKALEAKQMQRQDFNFQFQGANQGLTASSSRGYNTMIPNLNYQASSFHSLPPGKKLLDCSAEMKN